ncbi:hypothetical protein JOF53_001222 [Crossiella equi]|uniref:Uncharacterized protein n=1 Tax=Crossiella equi TaxID=130796 RepID=A0ABS5A6X6_9PSEU|nr:hypothetical protein [Crossiella equi]MBP2472350.1 hypothetical protein [Crossiella equi]
MFKIRSAQVQALYKAAPAAWQGPFHTREDEPEHNRDHEPLPAECASAELTEVLSDRTPVVSIAYGVQDNTGLVYVLLYRIKPGAVVAVEQGLRAARHCTHSPAPAWRSTWTKLDTPWFGGAGAAYRLGNANNAHSIWTFSSSQEWGLQVTSTAGAHNDTSVAAVTEVLRNLARAWDPVLGTEFGRSAPSGGGCGSPVVAAADMPYPDRDATAPNARSGEAGRLIGLHDAACRGDASWLRSAMPGPVVLDHQVAVPQDSLVLDDPEVLARVLRSRPARRDGALVFRDGPSVAVFTTGRSKTFIDAAVEVRWSAFVRDCTTSTGPARSMCEDTPTGSSGRWTGRPRSTARCAEERMVTVPSSGRRCSWT